jgi:hypothetical protein
MLMMSVKVRDDNTLYHAKRPHRKRGDFFIPAKNWSANVQKTAPGGARHDLPLLSPLVLRRLINLFLCRHFLPADDISHNLGKFCRDCYVSQQPFKL